MEKKILLLGNVKLYEKSEPVSQDELPAMRGLVTDLHDTMMAFRRKHHAGRAIAAPQIGVRKRVLYMNVDGQAAYNILPNEPCELLGRIYARKPSEQRERIVSSYGLATKKGFFAGIVPF